MMNFWIMEKFLDLINNANCIMSFSLGKVCSGSSEAATKSVTSFSLTRTFFRIHLLFLLLNQNDTEEEHREIVLVPQNFIK